MKLENPVCFGSTGQSISEEMCIHQTLTTRVLKGNTGCSLAHDSNPNNNKKTQIRNVWPLFTIIKKEIVFLYSGHKYHCYMPSTGQRMSPFPLVCFCRLIPQLVSTSEVWWCLLIGCFGPGLSNYDPGPTGKVSQPLFTLLLVTCSLLLLTLISVTCIVC